jgi:hypothetical protein
VATFTLFWKPTPVSMVEVVVKVVKSAFVDSSISYFVALGTASHSKRYGWPETASDTRRRTGVALPLQTVMVTFADGTLVH